MTTDFFVSTTKLGVEQTFRLIAEYRRNECLWNTKSPDYRNRELRVQLLANMADVCNISVAETESYIHSLRTSYGRQLKRTVQSPRTGPHPYVPRWIYFTQLDFLRDVIQPRNRRGQNHTDTDVRTNDTEELLDECSVTECSVPGWSDDADSVVAVDAEPTRWTSEHLQQQVPDDARAVSPPELKHRPSPPPASLTLDVSDLCWDGSGGSSVNVRTRRQATAVAAPFRHLVQGRDMPDPPPARLHQEMERRSESGTTTTAAFGQFVGTFLDTLPPDDQHRAMLEIHQLLFQIKSGH